MSYSLINPELLDMAFAKVAEQGKSGFVPGGDPGGLAGGDPNAGAAMPSDPSVGGAGAPPADPSMGGGAPPAIPPAPAPGISPPMQAVEPIKPKIDINVAILQILKLLARITDALGIPIPASEMVATQGDLTQMGMQQQTGGAAPGGAGAIPPVSPVQPAFGKTSAYTANGTAFDGSSFDALSSKASAIQRIRAMRTK
jgi:hypothetical protein